MDNHLNLRQETMKSFLRKKDSYSVYFENPAAFEACVKDCERDGVWNTDVIDLAPDIVSALLNATITIYNFRTGDDSVDEPVVFSGGEDHKITLLRIYGCHYNLLVPVGEAVPVIPEEEDPFAEAAASADEDNDSVCAAVDDEENYDRPETDEEDDLLAREIR